MKHERHFVCLPEIEYDLAEIVLENFPVVLTAIDDHSRVDGAYRSDGDGLYSRLGSVKTIFDEIYNVNPFHHKNRLFSDFVFEMKNQHIGSQDVENIYPNNLDSLLSRPDTNRLELEQATAIVNKIINTPHSQSDFHFWSEKTEQLLSDVIICDGEVWLKHPDLCYKVDLEYGDITVASAKIFDIEIRDRRYNRDWSSLSFRYFALHEYDDALNCLQNYGKIPADINQADLDRIDLVSNIDLATDVRKKELIRLAEVCLYELDIHIAQDMSHDEMAFEKIPVGLAIEASEIKEVLASGANLNEDKLIEHLQKFESHLHSDDPWICHFVQETGLNADNIGQMITSWEDREISIPTIKF